MVEADKIVMDGPENVNVMTFLEAHSSFFWRIAAKSVIASTGLKTQLLRIGRGRVEMVTQIPDGHHGLQRASHHLGGSRAARGIRDLRLEELSVGEDNAQLIVQAVEQKAEFRRIDHIASRAHITRDARAIKPGCVPAATPRRWPGDPHGAGLATVCRRRFERIRPQCGRIRSYPTRASCRWCVGSRRPVRTPS